MKCALNGPNTRIIAKAVQSLSKFGVDLYIEADQSGFQLRAVNANKSAVGTFKFYRDFFEEYDVSGGSSGDENYCRLSMKASLGVFKRTKHVQMCYIKIEPMMSKFVVQMDCRHETVKHFIISIIDDDNISADVPMDNSPNSILGSHKIFSEIASVFHNAEEELTLECYTDRLNVKNYVEGSRVNENFMKSEMKLATGEFLEYNITEEAVVTFCLREFKAFLLFADSVYGEVNINFHEAGSPIIFRVNKAEIFGAYLIMSTLSPDDITMCDEYQANETSLAAKKPTAGKRTKRPNNASRAALCPSKSQRLNNTDNSTQIQSMTFEESPNFEYESQSVDLLRNHASIGKSDELPRIPNVNAATSRTETIQPDDPAGGSESEVFVTFVETEENSEKNERIPQSPGHSEQRGLRSIFSRCFEATYVPREPSPNSHVFVPDSDDED